jgi:hypothetical protein
MIGSSTLRWGLLQLAQGLLRATQFGKGLLKVTFITATQPRQDKDDEKNNDLVTK